MGAFLIEHYRNWRIPYPKFVLRNGQIPYLTFVLRNGRMKRLNLFTKNSEFCQKTYICAARKLFDIVIHFHQR